MSSLLFPTYKLSRKNNTQPEKMFYIVFEKAKCRGRKVNKANVYEKQPSAGIFKKGVMINFTEFTRKHL